MKRVYLVPNIITAFSLACGLFVIFKINMVEPGSGDYDVVQNVGLFTFDRGLRRFHRWSSGPRDPCRERIWICVRFDGRRGLFRRRALRPSFKDSFFGAGDYHFFLLRHGSDGLFALRGAPPRPLQCEDLGGERERGAGSGSKKTFHRIADSGSGCGSRFRSICFFYLRLCSNGSLFPEKLVRSYWPRS